MSKTGQPTPEELWQQKMQLLATYTKNAVRAIDDVLSVLIERVQQLEKGFNELSNALIELSARVEETEKS